MYKYKYRKNKMKSKIAAIILMILMASLVSFVLPKKAYAGGFAPAVETPAETSGDEDFSIGSIIKSVKEFFNKGKEGSDEIVDPFIEKIKPLGAALYFTGLAIAIGVAMLLGIKFVTSEGDGKAKAELKERLIGFVIAVIVLVLAIPIWKFVVNILSTATGFDV